MQKKDVFFNNPTLGKKSLKRVVLELANFIKEEPGYFYHLVVGTDSQDHTDNGLSFLNLVSAIVVHREGRGGRYFWHKHKLPVSHSLREKIYRETLASLSLAQKLLPLLRQKLNGDEYDLEIHIDVGNAGQTRDMIKEVVAMVGGNGFKAKTKPESYGASSVADKYT